jgi:hypothetical protein
MYRPTFFLTSALVGGEWSASRPGRFTPGERDPGTRWIGGWVSPSTGLNGLKKRKFLTLPGLELRPLGRPTRSQSLYRLCYQYFVVDVCSIVYKGDDLRLAIFACYSWEITLNLCLD